MTPRQNNGLIIILVPIIVIGIILTIFYYSGFLQIEFDIWNNTALDILVFVVLMTIGLLALIALPICLIWGLIYLLRPTKIAPEIIPLLPPQQVELKNRLDIIDNIIFLYIAIFMNGGAVWYLVDWFMSNKSAEAQFLHLDLAQLTNIIETVDSIFMLLMFIAVLGLIWLFNRHFKLRTLLGLKGIDSLAERLKKFFIDIVGRD